MIITYCLNNKIVEGYEQTQDCIGTYEPQYGACSKTCGGGSQVLKFVVDIDPVSGYFRGNKKEPIPCPLDLTRECNTHNCPIDCEYVGGGEGWGNWIKNLDSNGKQIGTETRTRQIRINDKYGGDPCGPVTETRDYDVDCGYSGWSSWEACSNTCGGGTQRRTRSILQQPKNGGNPCGELEQTQNCNTQPCPVDCVGSWSNTQNCRAATGKITKKYTISQLAQHGGTPCGYSDGATINGDTNCNVNCAVSGWSEYSSCSKSCDSGTQSRTRTITRNKKNNGANCPTLSETQTCNTHACPKTEEACFEPDTKVMTYSGKLIPMKDMELNTKLKNGSTVLSVMRISNLDSCGNINLPMYAIESGEDNGPIYVTGTHLVYDPKLKEYVKVENLEAGDRCKISSKECRELSCLITSDHAIPIGDWIFHDWEDNNGSPSKSIQ